ncbi:MAG: GxxExxY protein [Verrucomicrobia bacterium]|nr:GxxExxY protein [Verrucomicrobiota bacterium]
MNSNPIDKELSRKVIAAALAVHRELGPGFLESIYETALCLELNALGVSHERQKTLPVFYRGAVVGEHRLDLLVEEKLVLELKATASLEKIHFSIVRSYLKATGLKDALLLNFATMPLTIKRVGREWSSDAEIPIS